MKCSGKLSQKRNTVGPRPTLIMVKKDLGNIEKHIICQNAEMFIFRNQDLGINGTGCKKDQLQLPRPFFVGFI